MSGACTLPAKAGAVRAMLGSVNCYTRDLAQRGYEAITGSQAFQLALTQVLIIYVALVGYRLLFAPDGARLSDGPRMALKLGAVLVLVSSWSVFETLAFDLAAKAPAEIAALISDGAHSGSQDPIGRLEVAYDQLSASATAFIAPPQSASSTPPQATPPTTAQTAQQTDATAGRRTAGKALETASGAVLMVDAGLIAVSTVTIGVLCAIGPIFVVLLIFRQTRGFFEGWVRALVAAGLISMSVWLLDLLMTATLQPWLVVLAQARALNQLNPGPAMTAASIALVFTAAQLALAAGAAVIAFGFRLPSDERFTPATTAPPTAERNASPQTLISRANLLADQVRRFDGVLEARGRTATGAAPGAVRTVGGETLAYPGMAGSEGFSRSAGVRDRLGRGGMR